MLYLVFSQNAMENISQKVPSTVVPFRTTTRTTGMPWCRRVSSSISRLATASRDVLVSPIFARLILSQSMAECRNATDERSTDCRCTCSPTPACSTSRATPSRTSSAFSSGQRTSSSRATPLRPPSSRTVIRSEFANIRVQFSQKVGLKLKISPTYLLTLKYKQYVS